MKLCGQLFLSMYMSQIHFVSPGPMRNYTNGYHPAGGADPRYLNYAAGVVVPNLVNPRIPGPGVSLKPRHHLERYIGVKPGLPDYEYPPDYNSNYYDESENELNDSIFSGEDVGVAMPELVSFNQHELTYSNSPDDMPETPGVPGQLQTNKGSFALIGGGHERIHNLEYAVVEGDSAVFRGKIHCRDGGRSYRSGEIFKLSSDPCTICSCSRFGPQCDRTQCESISRSCLELLIKPDECCPVCLKDGCIFRNRTLSVGQIVELSACETCHCEEDGMVQCSVADCTPPPCVDHSVEAGRCCPTCPNGPNCYTSNHTVIPARNEWVTVPDQNCTICRCWHRPGSQQLWMGNRMAECKRDHACDD